MEENSNAISTLKFISISQFLFLFYKYNIWGTWAA